MGKVTKSYLVCATPRSGSTLLCALLAGTGVAGPPQEFFEHLRALRPAAPAARVLRGRRRRRRARPARADRPGRARAAATRSRPRSSAGTTPNGVFGGEADVDAPARPRRPPRPRRAEPALLDERCSGRRATSTSRAATRSPRRSRCGAPCRRAPGAPATSRRRAGGLPRRRDRSPRRPAREQDEAWRAWFAANGIQPLTIAYEDARRATRAPPSSRCSRTSAPGRPRSRSRRCAGRATTARPAGSSASVRRWRRERVGAAAAGGGVDPRHARGRGRAGAPAS